VSAGGAAARPFDLERAIPPEEFRSRQQRLRELAAAEGLDGIVVYSRGGGPIDMSADVFYLTNHYSQQPYMTDHVGIGRARSHGVVVLPADGPGILVVDVPWWRKDLVVADDVRPGNDVTAKAADAIRSAGLAGRRVGLVGASNMTAAAYLGLVAELPDTTFVRADDLVERLRLHKSPSEVAVLRRAIALGSAAVTAAFEAVVPGATEGDAAAAAAAVIASGGGAFYDTACASGPWAHGFTWARMPSWDAARRFEPGDIFHMDSYGALGGYFWDFGRTRVAGDEPTDAQRALLETAIEVVKTVCAAIRPGRSAAEVYREGERVMAASPVLAAIPEEAGETEGFPAIGHGIGLGWEKPWLTPTDETVLEPGMAIAVEVLFGHPSIGGGFFEENGIVIEAGFEVLSTTPTRWWAA
jgi:Xaa-Pro aminopeptidase